jgi:head-tail adaptor
MTLAERLRPLQDALAELEREHYLIANADNEPADWAAWSDLATALAAVRSAQGRERRAAGFRPDAEATP